MAEETANKSNSSFPFFKLLSIFSVVYLVIIALEVNIPYLSLINKKIALLVISAIFFINILTGGKGNIKSFKKNLAKELIK